MTDRKHTTKKHGEKVRAAMATEVSAGAQAASDEVAAPVVEVEAGDDLAKVAAERDAYLEHLQRLQAEFDNYRKRVRRDHEELRQRAAETVVESLLPVMDNMGRALVAADQHEEGQLVAGLELVAGQLTSTLEGHGLTEVLVQPGSAFDPTVHEAILTQASDEFEEGEVLQVLERGYLLHGRLLRPAKVIVVQ